MLKEHNVNVICPLFTTAAIVTSTAIFIVQQQHIRYYTEEQLRNREKKKKKKTHTQTSKQTAIYTAFVTFSIFQITEP